MFGSFKYILYLCTCVFHSIRFKVNKGLELGGAPFFYIYTYSIYYNKNSPTASQWQRNNNVTVYYLKI